MSLGFSPHEQFKFCSLDPSAKRVAPFASQEVVLSGSAFNPPAPPLPEQSVGGPVSPQCPWLQDRDGYIMGSRLRRLPWWGALERHPLTSRGPPESTPSLPSNEASLNCKIPRLQSTVQQPSPYRLWRAGKYHLKTQKGLGPRTRALSLGARPAHSAS